MSMRKVCVDRENVIAKAIVIMIFLLAFLIYTLFVYYAGRIYAVNNTRVFYLKNGVCVYELDGREYLTPMEGWVNR